MADTQTLDPVYVDEGAAPVSPAVPAAPAPSPQAVAEDLYDGTAPIVSADGVKHNFPAGTPMANVDKAMKAYAEEHRNKSTTLGQMSTGFMDPLEGGGQLVAHGIKAASAPFGADATKTLDAVNNWISDKTGLLRKLPEGGKDEQVKEREKAIDAERGHSKDFDFARAAGSALQPVQYLGGMAVKAPGALAALGSSVLGGATSGAMQPATGDDFATEKATQTGVGAAVGGAIGAVGSAASKTVEKVGEYIARNYPDNIATQAVQTVLRRIKQDQKAGGLSATDALDAINAARKPLTLADVSGENTLGLAGNVARQPGESRAVAKQFLEERDEGAASRLSQDIADNLSGDKTAHQAAEMLLSQRSAAGKPAYDAAFKQQNVWSPRLAEFFDDPTIKQGLARGFDRERIVALAEGRPITATQMGVDLDTQGNAKLIAAPNMRLLDMAKQGLDALISDERNELTGRLSARGVALDQLRRAYVQEIDNLDKSGLYKKARESWAGYSSSLDAVRAGRAVFGASPEENTAAIAKMSDANKEFYRIGVADVLKERLAKAGFSADESKQLIKNSWMRDQLKPAFKTQADFDRFADAVAGEHQMFATKASTLGGSPTAARVAEDAGGTGNMVAQGSKAVGQLLAGHPLGAAKTAWQFYRDIGLKPNPELNEKISRILFSTHFDPADPITQQLSGASSPTLRNPASRAVSSSQSVTRYGATGAGGGAAAIMEDPNRQQKQP